MATRLYLHASTAAAGLPSGTLPTAEQSSLTVTSGGNYEADQTANRVMNTTISTTAQTSLAKASIANTSANNYYVARWVSPKIDDTSVAANTWTYNFAAAQSNANANFPVSSTNNQPVRVNCYVWKPSNGTKYGTILDGNTASTVDSATAATIAARHVTFTGAEVSSLTPGDAVIVFEAWFVVTQAMATGYTQTFYYDGTTANTTDNATVSNHASFVETPQDVTFTVEIKVKKGTFAKSTSTGVPVSQPVTGVGFQPKALLLWTERSTAETFGSNYNISIGFSDGTNHRCQNAQSENNVNPSDASVLVRNDAILDIAESAGGTAVARASVTAFGSDGFTLSWSLNTVDADVIHYLALAGDNLTNAKAGTITTDVTATGNRAYTGVGFQPDSLLLINTGNTTTQNTRHDGLSFSMGVATSSTERGMISNNTMDNQTTTQAKGYNSAAHVIQILAKANAAVEGRADLVSFDSNGFTLDWEIAPVSATNAIYYFALKGLNALWSAGTFNAATSTGDQTVTVSGINVQGALLFSGCKATSASVTNNNRVAIGATDGTNVGCIWSGDAHGIVTPTTSATNKRQKTDKVIMLATEHATTPVVDAEASLTSMGNNGFVLNWSTADASVSREIIYLVVGKASGANDVIKAVPTETITISETLDSPLRNKIRTRSETITVSD